jgi:hypothetical protein
MYVWLWRHLPGSMSQRILQAVLLLVAFSLLLLFVIFPWIGPHLPPNPITGTVTVNQ